MTTEEAQEKAGAVWCHPTTKHKVMDPEVALVFAEVLKEETDKAYQDGRQSAYRPQGTYE